MSKMVGRRTPPGLIQNLFDLLAEICDEKNLKVTLIESCKGGLLTGLTSLVGGLAFGPRGIVAGAVFGSILSVTSCQSFKPLSQVLKEMDQKKKENLIEKIKSTFKVYGISDVPEIIQAVKSRQHFQDLLLKAALSFVNNDLGLSIK